MTEKNRSLQLDCVRAIAIFLAMGWHFNFYTGIAPLDALIFPGRSIGWVGVDLFFVLSGFLVGRLIFIELKEDGTFNYGRFLIRRIFRLWPVLYIYLFFTLIIGDKPYMSFFWQVFFHVQNYFPTPLPQLWSLAVEEHFYLVAGLALPWFARRKTTPLHYAIGLGMIIPICLALRFLGASEGFSRLQLQTYTHFRADALAGGVLLALISLSWPNLFNRMAKPKLALLFIAILSAFCLVKIGSSPPSRTYGYTISIIGSSALILAAYEWNWPRVITPAVNAMAALGLFSYSIYIWHHAFGHVSDILLAKAHLNAPWLVLLGRYGLAIVGSVIISKLIERPMIALRDRLFPRPVRRDASVATFTLEEGEKAV